jgi:hypothetical protein
LHQGSEESDEYTTDESEEEDAGPVLLKPAFVPKTDREVGGGAAEGLPSICYISSGMHHVVTALSEAKFLACFLRCC